MKRVILLTAAVSLLVGFGAGCFFAMGIFAVGTVAFHAKTIMDDMYHSHHAPLHVRCFAKKYS